MCLFYIQNTNSRNLTAKLLLNLYTLFLCPLPGFKGAGKRASENFLIWLHLYLSSGLGKREQRGTLGAVLSSVAKGAWAYALGVVIPHKES